RIQSAALQLLSGNTWESRGCLGLFHAERAHGHNSRDGERIDAPITQHADPSCRSQGIPGGEEPGINTSGEAPGLQQRCGFALKHAVGYFDNHPFDSPRSRMINKEAV